MVFGNNDKIYTHSLYANSYFIKLKKYFIQCHKNSMAPIADYYN